MGFGSRGGTFPCAAYPVFMKCVWSVWPMLRRRIRSKRIRLLVLDFDGTLTAIAKTPQAAVLEKKTKEVLTRLSRSPSYRLAIVSGRSLKNLMPFFCIKNIFYAGNHGLEMKGKKLRLSSKVKEAKKLEALVWFLGEKLKENFLKVPGILIEDKNYTLSLHYRNVPREFRPFFKQKVAS